jgi:anti-anti-sigma factor
VEIHHVEGIAVVRAIACENDDNQLSEPWAQELLEASDQLDPPVLVLDFSDVALMRPRAMAALLQTHRRLRQRGGQLVLAAVSAPLADLIQITGFGREMHVAASCDEAIVHLSSCGSESEDA